MNTDIKKWLSLLPFAEEQAANGIVLNGCLVSSQARKATILVGGVYLSFHRSDILEIEPADSTEDPVHPPSKVAIRVVIRRGASLLDIGLGQLDDEPSHHRRPFALSVRSLAATPAAADRFRNLERQFLLRHSLLVNDSHSV